MILWQGTAEAVPIKPEKNAGFSLRGKCSHDLMGICETSFNI